MKKFEPEFMLLCDLRTNRVRHADNVEAVRQRVGDNPKLPVRRSAQRKRSFSVIVRSL